MNALTPKIGDALIVALEAPGNTLTRCAGGFRDPAAHLYPEGRQDIVTRRTGNALVNAGLADYNDRRIPSSMTLTRKGFDIALEHALKVLSAAPEQAAAA